MLLHGWLEFVLLAQTTFPLDFLFMPPGIQSLFRGEPANANKHSTEMNKKEHSLCLWSRTNACNAIVYTKLCIMIACLFSWKLWSSQSYSWGFGDCLVHFFLLVKSFVYSNLTERTSVPARSEILWPTMINTHVGRHCVPFFVPDWTMEMRSG